LIIIIIMHHDHHAPSSPKTIIMAIIMTIIIIIMMVIIIKNDHHGHHYHQSCIIIITDIELPFRIQHYHHLPLPPPVFLLTTLLTLPTVSICINKAKSLLGGGWSVIFQPLVDLVNRGLKQKWMSLFSPGLSTPWLGRAVTRLVKSLVVPSSSRLACVAKSAEVVLVKSTPWK